MIPYQVFGTLYIRYRYLNCFCHYWNLRF